MHDHAVCSCTPGYIGSAPNCRPECVVSSECAQDRACVNQKCIDPCPSTCGQNARCQVVNHNPICSCSPGFTGDPFIRCLPERKWNKSTQCPWLVVPSIESYKLSKQSHRPIFSIIGRNVQHEWLSHAQTNYSTIIFIAFEILYVSTAHLIMPMQSKFRVHILKCWTILIFPMIPIKYCAMENANLYHLSPPPHLFEESMLTNIL